MPDPIPPCTCEPPTLPGGHHACCPHFALDQTNALDALPAALSAYECAALAVRAARADLQRTLVAAGFAAEAFLSLDSTAETIATIPAALAIEAQDAAAFAASLFDALADAKGRDLADLRRIQVRGQARALLACDCGTCEPCTLARAARAANTDPVGEVAAVLMRNAEPERLVTADGAPLRAQRSPVGSRRSSRGLAS